MEAGIGRQRAWHKAFAADLIPGLTTAAVVVPKALAYATIAQLPVQAGLFAALVPRCRNIPSSGAKTFWQPSGSS